MRLPTVKGITALTLISLLGGDYIHIWLCVNLFLGLDYVGNSRRIPGDGPFRRMSLLNFEKDKFTAGAKLDRDG